MNSGFQDNMHRLKNNSASVDYEQIAAARAQWLEGLAHPEKNELLFCLEMNLKGLDRFFNLNNHPFSSFEKLMNRDFNNELLVVLLGVNRVIMLSDELLQEKSKNIFYFQRYILDKLLEDFSRDFHVKRGVTQDSPEASLHMLRLTFINLKTLLIFLNQASPDISYLHFNSVGQLITTEIARNRFFNPFLGKPFQPEYDRNVSPIISQIMGRVHNRQFRKKTSIIYLALYRLLHYLHYVNPLVEELDELKSYLLYFSLINSEYKTLIHFIEKDYFPFLDSLKAPLAIHEMTRTDEHTNLLLPQKLHSAIDSLLYQLRMEMRNVNERVLKNLIIAKDEHRLRGSMENARGILTNLLQQVIVYISQEFDNSIRGEKVFADFISRFRQSKALRRDIWLFRELMNYYEEIIETDYTKDTTETYKEYFKTLKKYISTFKNSTMMLLRYDDAIEFQQFFDTLDQISEDELETVYVLESFKLSAKYFKIFLETMLGNISNRSELQGQPIDMQEGRDLLKQFIPSS